MYHRPASFWMAVLRARPSDSLVAILDRAVHSQNTLQRSFTLADQFSNYTGAAPRLSTGCLSEESAADRLFGPHKFLNNTGNWRI